MERQKARIDFTEGKLLKNIFFFSVPMILSTVIQLLFNAADVAVVGRFAGTVYQSAVGATSSTIHLIINLLIGLSIGANIVMATAFGEKDEEKQSRIVHTSMALAIVGGIAVMFIGIFLSEPLMRLLDTPSDAFEYSVLYMRVYFLGAPANIVYNFAASVYRGVGETKRPLYYLFVSGVLNVLINVITVVFFHMHVVGVALGTVLSQYVAAIWVIRDLRKEKNGIRYEIKKTRFYKKELRGILLFGIPTGISSCCFSLSNLLIQSSVNAYGSTVVAGNTVAVNVDAFIDAFTASIGKATVTAIGQNVGAKKYRRIRKTMGAGILVSLFCSICIALFMLLLGKYVYALFNGDEEVIKIALIRMQFTTMGYTLVGFMEVFGAALRGLGYSISQMFVNLTCVCLFRIFWISWFYPLAPCLEMIYIAYPITWVLSGLAQGIAFLIAERRFKKKVGVDKSVSM